MVFVVIAVFATRKNWVKADEATTIEVNTAEQFVAALATIHSNSNKSYVIEVGGYIELHESDGTDNKLTIDNGNTVTINGNGNTIAFQIESGSKINVTGGASLYLKGGTSTLDFKGPGPGERSATSFVTISNGNVYMYDNVTLSNNYSGSTGSSCGGVKLTNDANFYMYGGSIERNAVESSEFGGAAVHLEQPTAYFKMTGGNISDNYCYYGGALFASSGATIDIENGTFTNNEATAYGGVAFIYDDTTMNIKNSTITNNTAYAGGFLINYGTVNMSGNTIKGNSATYGGAIYSEGYITSVNDDISENTSDGYGGGVCIDGISADFSKSKVYNNKATQGASDFYIDNATEEIKIMEPGLMGKQATIDGETVNVNLYRRDNPGDRYSLTNITSPVLVPNVTGGNQYLLIATGDGYEVAYDDGSSSTENAKTFVGSGSTVKLDLDGGTCSETELTITANTVIEKPTKEGFRFKGWSLIQLEAYDLAFKANWEEITTSTYIVKFDANGGDGEMAAQEFIYGEEANLNENKFTKSGYTFTGWNTKADGTGDSYTDKQSIKDLTDEDEAVITFYAQWKEEATEEESKEAEEATEEEPSSDNEKESDGKVKTGDTIMKWTAILAIATAVLALGVKNRKKLAKVKGKRFK